MKSERILWALAAVALVGLGMLFAQLAPRQDAVPSALEGLWLTRRFDLIVQLLLLLVGTLGIRAILPSEGEAEEEE